MADKKKKLKGNGKQAKTKESMHNKLVRFFSGTTTNNRTEKALKDAGL